MMYERVNLSGTSVQKTFKSGNSRMSISHVSDWKRLEVYNQGDIVSFNGKTWESVADENFNHLPDQSRSEFWKELGAGYKVDREDWTVTNVGYEDRFYFITPDGKLFENKLEAENHTLNLLISSSNRVYTNNFDLFNDVDALIKETSYAVPQFDVDGSESQGIVYFDSQSQTHRLSAFAEGDSPVSGSFTHGTIKSESETAEVGDIILKNGTYYLLLEQNPSSLSKAEGIVVNNLIPPFPKEQNFIIPFKINCISRLEGLAESGTRNSHG